MAIRGDISIDFDSSPRIITVASPSTTLLIQDLVDTIRFIEAEQINLSYSTLLRATGKDDLGGGDFTGITATLQNAQVAFEDRPGPSTIQCSIKGGNLVAVDTNEDPMSPIKNTAFTQPTLYQSTSPTLVTTITGSAVTEQDKEDIAAKVWTQSYSTDFGNGSLGEYIKTKILNVTKFLSLK